jgi:hypothetical protein
MTELVLPKAKSFIVGITSWYAVRGLAGCAVGLVKALGGGWQ